MRRDDTVAILYLMEATDQPETPVGLRRKAADNDISNRDGQASKDDPEDCPDAESSHHSAADSFESRLNVEHADHDLALAVNRDDRDQEEAHGPRVKAEPSAPVSDDPSWKRGSQIQEDEPVVHVEPGQPTENEDSPHAPTEDQAPQASMVEEDRREAADRPPSEAREDHIPLRRREQAIDDPTTATEVAGQETEDPTNHDPTEASGADNPPAEIAGADQSNLDDGRRSSDPPDSEQSFSSRGQGAPGPPVAHEIPDHERRDAPAYEDLIPSERGGFSIDHDPEARTVEPGDRSFDKELSVDIASPDSTSQDDVADRVVAADASDSVDQVADAPDHEFVETPDEPEDMDAYRRIRAADDVDQVADNSGFPRGVVQKAKEHLFNCQHEVVLGPGTVRYGYFTPLPTIWQLWDRVASGDELTEKQRVEFWSFLAHEYVEAKLMAAGLPYLSSHPDAWDEAGRARVTRDHPGAHTVAPLSLQSNWKDLLKLWPVRFDIEKDDLRVAEDLSNLDEVVRVAKEGLGL